MTIDWIMQQAGVIWRILQDSGLWLLDIIGALASHVTRDHVEGALVMAVIFLGPSLMIGLARGFWQGLRIEWQQLRGRPWVIDGDTLEIRGERIRLYAIDTPELGQPWWNEDDDHADAGLLAKEALAALIQGRRLSVRVLREDQYGRSIGIVKVDGRDVAKSLVSRGLAFASPGHNRYRRSHNAARRRKTGFWRGDLQMPWEYRAVA